VRLSGEHLLFKQGAVNDGEKVEETDCAQAAGKTGSETNSPRRVQAFHGAS
jgi:hypothetical protein